ncbi:LPS assembly lipoprotein LptE [Proteus mirabilis]|uniref:LPS assembly lipoprotein LptE n=1 Tax=Proteus mirabilis TaxID=584 RepID=UPI0033146C31
MRYLFSLFFALAVLVTAGCGFHLQGKTQVPAELKTLYLSSGDPYGPLSRVMRQQLRLSGVQLVETPKADIPVLKIVGSSENKETDSVYQDGKSAERQLTFVLDAQVIMPDGTIYPISSQVSRPFFDNPLEALAKDAENDIIKQEMREQATAILVRKLLVVHNAERQKASEAAKAKQIISPAK